MVTFLNNADERLMSRILRDNRVRREEFDPTNKEHLNSYLTYLKTGNWGSVQFFCEFPYVTVPETVLRKYAIYTLERQLGLVDENTTQ